MLDIIKVSALFVLMVLLLRRKWNVGYVLLLSAFLLSASYLMPPARMLLVIRDAAVEPVTVKLLVALTAIRVFELILRERDILKEMMASARALLRRRRAVMVSMPLLIGLLPSVGGAYFSAPMVEESSKGADLSPEEKGFINYWFRHPWEYVLPLYPGIVLASAITGMEMRHLIVSNASYALMVALTGFAFSMRGAGGRHPQAGGVSRKGLLSFLPVAAVLLMVMALRIELHWALLAGLAGLFVFYRYGPKEILRALRYGLSSEVIVLIGGAMLFKEAMEASGAIENISGFFGRAGIPLMPMLFVLPFSAGLLTGLTVGFVGSTFPLLLSFMAAPSLPAVSFAFASGFVGVLLSPVHVCLVLTREYFKADLWGMYRRTIPASALIMAVAALQYLLLRRMAP